MDKFQQPPPPLLPDLVASPINDNCYLKQQVPADNCTVLHTPTTSTQACLLPPPPSPPYQPVHVNQVQLNQLPQLSEIVPQNMPTSQLVEEFEKIMSSSVTDKVVLTNSVCLLYRFSIDSAKGAEVCQCMSSSHLIMSCLHHLLTNPQFQDDYLIVRYATGNLTTLSTYEEGRTAILNFNGVESLIHSLKSRDSDVVIFAITAIHNLLLDRRVDHQDSAKEQIIILGIEFIVKLLDNEFLRQNYQFIVCVLDCLQIIAYGNKENRLAIKESGGPDLLLRTISDNLDTQPTDELIETASRVLKSLSVCPENKIDIIENGGVIILTGCIGKNNPEILKTCLWTLRNLSDVINNSIRYHASCIPLLVGRLLVILERYAEHPCIVTCALGILANLTCNNESVKKMICEQNGVDLLISTVAHALSDRRDYRIAEILEPAICALCHLMNQSNNPGLVEETRMAVEGRFDMFKSLIGPHPMISDDLSKAAQKLLNLTSNLKYNHL